MVHCLDLKCPYWGGDGLCLLLFDEELFPDLSDEERVVLDDNPYEDYCPYSEMLLDEEENWEEE